MHRPDEQATLEHALGYFGVGMVVLCIIAIPLSVFIPALRVAVGVVLLLAGLFAWVSHWAVRSE
jgi:hypothetical protein